MVKHFCDLCGKPAMEFWPELRVDFPEQTWRGVKSEPGSIGVVDGNWTPHITARVIFEAHDTQRSVRNHNPDICAFCVAELLTKMSAGLVARAESSNAPDQRPGATNA